MKASATALDQPYSVLLGVLCMGAEVPPSNTLHTQTHEHMHSILYFSLELKSSSRDLTAKSEPQC